MALRDQIQAEIADKLNKRLTNLQADLTEAQRSCNKVPNIEAKIAEVQLELAMLADWANSK